MKRILGSLFAILAIAMFVMACGDDKEPLKCADGQVAAVGNDGKEQCYPTCNTTADCPNPSTQQCRSTQNKDVKVCLEKKTTDTPDDDAGNGTGDTPSITEEHKILCEDYCYIEVGCFYEWCGSDNLNPAILQNCLNGSENDPTDNGCIGDLTGTSDDAAKIEAKAEEFKKSVYYTDGTKATCDDKHFLRCSIANILKKQGANLACGCIESETIGDACTTIEDCDKGGTLPAACYLETGKDESGKDVDTGFTGGYCFAQYCDLDVALEERIVGHANPKSTGCGADNYCIYEQTKEGVLGACFDGCEKTEDCRPGYSCDDGGTIVKTEKMAKICMPANCKEDKDCGTGDDQGRCDVDTKVCELPCKDAKAKAYCESGGGECTGDGDKTFCVLP